MGRQSFSVSLDLCPPLTELESLWRDLEERASANFFLTWDWIGPWLTMVRKCPSLVKVSHGQQCVALGFVAKHERSFIGRALPGLYLNQTGQPQEDAIFIEYNHVLLDQTHSDEAFAALMAFLIDAKDPWLSGWCEFSVGGITDSVLQSLRSLGYDPHVQEVRTAPYRDLSQLGEGGVLPALSRNTRYQVQRSLKLYQERGEITLQAAQSKEEAMSWLGFMKEFHQKTWVDRGQEGAFANPSFETFIHGLVKCGVESGKIDLLKVSAGSEPIGFLFNLIESSRILNYQSGFAYSDNPHIKPGLVCHTLAMDHYAARGFKVYNFLAGESQYKLSLADQADTLNWVTLTRPSWVLSLEQSLKKLKAQMTHLSRVD